jgi:hypothetical protein
VSDDANDNGQQSDHAATAAAGRAPFSDLSSIRQLVFYSDLDHLCF